MSYRLYTAARALARPTFETVYTTGLPYVRQSLRWLGVEDRDLDDVLQDVMLAAYRGLDSYDPERAAKAGSDSDRGEDEPGGAGEPRADLGAPPTPADGLKRWLLGIAWRQASHYRDRAYRRREVPVGAGATWPFHPPDPSLSSEQRVAKDQLGQLITRLLGKIEIDRRIVLIMNDLLDIPIAHIAGELGLNENTARNRLRLAREDFRVAVKRMNAEERQALRTYGLLPISELRRGLDEQALVRAARVIPPVPEALRRRLWDDLQRALAHDRPEIERLPAVAPA
jgi:RNA polymerase sigma-70 factor (ECF subfamily)